MVYSAAAWAAANSARRRRSARACRARSSARACLKASRSLRSAARALDGGVPPARTSWARSPQVFPPLPRSRPAARKAVVASPVRAVGQGEHLGELAQVDPVHST